MAASQNRKRKMEGTRPSEFKEIIATELSPDLVDVLDERYKNQSKTPFFLFVLIVLVAALAVFLFTKVNALEKIAATNTNTAVGAPVPQPTRPTSLPITKPDPTKDHWRGNTNARYVWVEYADFECPFCKQIHPDLVHIMGQYPDTLAWVYRHYPLSFHPKAEKSAEAAECAQDQAGPDAFWTMGDTIVDKMPDMELSQLPDIAASLGYNKTTFAQCLDSGKFAAKVKAQLAEGTNAGVQATPTNVIYDMQTGKNLLIEGALPYDALKQVLDSFLALSNLRS